MMIIAHGVVVTKRCMDLDAGFVGIVFQSVDRRIAAALVGAHGVTDGGCGSAREQVLKGFAELARHAAVDGEVDGVRQADEEVGEHDDHVEDAPHLVRQAPFEDVVEDVDHGEHGQRQLDDQKDGDDDDQHQRGAVGVALPAALALGLVVFEQLHAADLGRAQRLEQQRVQHDQSGARSQVDEQHAEPEVNVEVDVLVLLHPERGEGSARVHRLVAPHHGDRFKVLL